MKALVTTVKNALRRAPGGSEEFLFEIASLSGSLFIKAPGIGWVLKSVGRAFAFLIQSISPAMSIEIQKYSSDPDKHIELYKVIFYYAYPITAFFCLGVNAALSIHVGTFSGDDKDRIYFSQDWYNIILYAIVCPLYVYASICLIVTTALSWKILNNHSNIASKHMKSFYPSDGMRIALFLTISFLISGVFISNYIDELTNPDITTTLYWFFNKAKSGERILNKAGGYYLFMNAVLLFITSMAAFCYISMSIEAFRLGRNIDKSTFSISVEEGKVDNERTVRDKDKRLKKELLSFSLCYIWAKVLVLIYALNIWIWQISPAGRVNNVDAAIIALFIIGLFFLVIPRLYVGSKWHKLKLMHMEHFSRTEHAYNIEDVEYIDVRTGNAKKFAAILNLIYALLLTIILTIQYKVGGFSDYIVRLITS